MFFCRNSPKHTCDRFTYSSTMACIAEVYSGSGPVPADMGGMCTAPYSMLTVTFTACGYQPACILECLTSSNFTGALMSFSSGDCVTLFPDNGADLRRLCCWVFVFPSKISWLTSKSGMHTSFLCFLSTDLFQPSTKPLGSCTTRRDVGQCDVVPVTAGSKSRTTICIWRNI